jgi:glycosyltransferase involved in cell wall biosynthesis
MGREQPLFTIVTISYNQIEFLKDSIESVLNQKADDIEYIVVDPGSTDGSRELLASYGNAIDKLVLEPDAGPADGLNKGFSYATGRVGYFLNSDDFLLPGAISKLRNLWRDTQSADVILAAGWMIDQKASPIRPLFSTKMSLKLLQRNQATLFQQGMSFSIRRFTEVGGFNPKNRTCWDYELLVDMILAGARVRVDRARIGAFRLHDSSLSGGGHGDAHEIRYQADVKRISERMSGDRASNSLFGGSLMGLLGKYFYNPAVGFHSIFYRLAPQLMRRRWTQDMLRVPRQ